jgi:hypothetical protein
MAREMAEISAPSSFKMIKLILGFTVNVGEDPKRLFQEAYRG